MIRFNTGVRLIVCLSIPPEINLQVPLTPALRAAKAAREQALQRAPLTRRSEAILYQVCQGLGMPSNRSTAGSSGIGSCRKT